MNFADMTAAQHLQEADQYYKRLEHYASVQSSGMPHEARNEKLKEALQWATYHSEQGALKQAAALAANAYLKAAYERKQAAAERLRKAHKHSTFKEFNAAVREWSLAFDAYQPLRKLAGLSLHA